MKYDPVRLPVGSRERAVVQFKKGDLVKALKTCKNGQIDLQSVHDELQNCVQKLQNKKQFGTILSAYYMYSSDLDNLVDSHTTFVKKLLQQMFAANDIPGFLKQAHRFGLYTGLEQEIEQAIAWHESRNLPDASAWRLKFQKLSEQIALKTPTDKPVELIREENIAGKLDIHLTLRPIKAHLSAKDDLPEDDEYIISQTSKAKIDRANKLHSATLLVLKNTLEQAGFQVGETKLVDAYASINYKVVIFEVKSINEHNERDQIRHAVSQLFEYRYLYQHKEALLCVVLSEEPHSQWLTDYLLNEHAILVTWVESGHLTGPSIDELLDRMT